LFGVRFDVRGEAYEEACCRVAFCLLHGSQLIISYVTEYMGSRKSGAMASFTMMHEKIGACFRPHIYVIFRGINT
jgi:hypothetical protein